MQILYQMDLVGDYSLDDLEVFLENFDKRNYPEEIDVDSIEDIVFSQDELDYIKSTIPEVILNLEKIDNLIDEHLEGWTINRLSKVDKETLRIAVYEFLYRGDIPKEVSINEAVEIAKIYGGDNSSKFVNGILGSIYRTLEMQNWREYRFCLRTLLSVLI